MRWRVLAQAAEAKLRARGALTPASTRDFVAALNAGDAARAFRSLHRAAARHALWGWNKFWDDRGVTAWLGSLAVRHPLRCVALELSADSARSHRVRITLAQGRPADSDDLILKHLGLTSEFDPDGGARRILLRRLNLDTREQPLVERWRWSSSAGLALLSDGGRFQISPGAVWLRLAELSLDEDGSLPPRWPWMRVFGGGAPGTRAEGAAFGAVASGLLDFYGWSDFFAPGRDAPPPGLDYLDMLRSLFAKEGELAPTH